MGVCLQFVGVVFPDHTHRFTIFDHHCDLDLIVSSVSQLRSSSMSVILLSRVPISVAYLAARLWTISMIFFSAWIWCKGSIHLSNEYSRFSRTSVK